MPYYQQKTYSSGTSTSLRIKISAKIDKNDIWMEWGKDSISVTAIEDYIQRIEKINKERIYCNQFLNQAFYFRNIDGIELCMNIFDNAACVDRIAFVFDDVKRYNDFFNDTSIRTILARYKR